MLLRALLSAIVASGGLDWASKTPLSAAEEAVVSHRIISKDRLKDDDEETDLVVDFTPLSQSAHKTWGTRDLATATKDEWEPLDRHLIPRAPVVAGDWQAFRRQRAKQIAALLERLAEGDK
jgi:hypothetical protein